MKGTRTLDPQRRRQALPVAQACRRGRPKRHHPLRARLLDGLAADVRPGGAGRAGLLGDGLVRASAASTPGAWTARAMGARTRRGRSTATSRTARTISRRRADYILEARAARRALVVRHFVGGAEGRRCSRSAIRSAWRASRSTPSCGPAKAARRSSERRKRLPEFQAKNRRPIDRAFVHSDLQPRPSRHAPTTPPSRPSPTRFSRSTTRCRPEPTSTCARGCRWSTRRRSACRRIVMRGQFDGIACMEDLLEFFCAAAASRQAVHGHGRHLARELPAEELPRRVPHPAFLFHTTRSGVPRMKTFAFLS